MESCVKYQTHRFAGHCFHAGFDSENVCGHMQRREFCISAADFHDLIRKKNGFIEVLRTVDNTVSDSIDLIHRTDRTVLRIDQSFQYQLDGNFMIGHVFFNDSLTLGRLMLQV